MDRRVAAGFLLAGTVLAVALARAAADLREGAGPPIWRAEHSFAGAVEVRGEVENAGIAPDRSGRRARDAVALRGPGVAPLRGDSDQPLREGDVVTLLPDGTVRVDRMPGERLLALGLRIDLNRATAEDLASLPGVGPATASRIVAWRTRRGPFRQLRDLTRVPGVGPRTLARVRPFLAVTSPSPGGRSR